MGSIHDKSDVVLLTENMHRRCIKCAVQTNAMMQRNVLLASLRAVVIGVASLFQHLNSFTAFRCTSEYQYHTYMYVVFRLLFCTKVQKYSIHATFFPKKCLILQPICILVMKYPIMYSINLKTSDEKW